MQIESRPAASLSLWPATITYLSPYLQVQCRDGLKLENSRNKFRCRDGEWKPSVPRCVPRDCHVPSLQHATRVPADVSHVPHGGQLRLTCHSGYRLAGLSTLRCDHGMTDLHFTFLSHKIFYTIITKVAGIRLSLCVWEFLANYRRSNTDTTSRIRTGSHYELCQNLHFL